LVTLVLGFLAMVVAGGAVFLQVIATSASEPSAGPPGLSGTESPGSGSGRTTTAPRTGAAPGGMSGAQAATANRLYQVGPLTGFGCVGRQIAPGDSVSFEAFLNSTTNCLDRTWSTAFSRAGLRFSPPHRVFWSTPGRSPCGDYPAPGVAAFYCSLNNSIYIGVAGHAMNSAGNLPVIYNVAYARNLAHEYAHHVQESSGILAYSREQRLSASSVDDRNAVTRRSELQAQCFAGVFMASVGPTFPVTPRQWQIALRDSYGRGDDASDPGSRDHGSNGHYAGWLNRGYTRGTTGACNTWTAPAAEVS
jgi:predicted metalloprotease